MISRLAAGLNGFPLLVALSLLAALAPFAVGGGAPRLLLDDFEAGVAKWATNDAYKQTGAAEAQLCEVVPTAGAPEEGKQRAALVTFRQARDQWASVSLPVEGARWQQLGVKQLALWFKGDGSASNITLMLRTRGGPFVDERFSVDLPLTHAQWQRHLIPLARLKNAMRNATEGLENVYLLQFVKTGSWDSLFFSLDQLELQSDGAAEPVKPPQEPAKLAPNETIDVSVDFGKTLGKTRLRLGGNLTIHPERLAENNTFRQSVTDLGVKLIRLNTSSLAVLRSEGDRAEFDFTVLDRVMAAVQAAGAQPLICLADDPAWGLAEEAFVSFCVAVVKRYSVDQKRRVAYYEVFNEPTSGQKAIPIAQAVTLYNKVRKAVRAVDATVKLGGLAEGSAWSPHLNQALTKTDGLDFLSFHFFGARNASASDQEVMEAGVRALAADLPHQLAPRAVLEMLNRNKQRAGTPIFITECAPNAGRGEAGESKDLRLTRAFASAWWMSFFINAARWIDVACVYDLSDESWGLLDGRGRAFPSFYAAWIFQTYVPREAMVCRTQSEAQQVLAFGVNTRTAHNLILVNTSDQPLAVSVTATGLVEPLTQVRARGVEDTTGLKAKTLEPKPSQQLTLAPQAVQMIQFVELKPPAAATESVANESGKAAAKAMGKGKTAAGETAPAPAKSSASKAAPARGTVGKSASAPATAKVTVTVGTSSSKTAWSSKSTATGKSKTSKSKTTEN